MIARLLLLAVLVGQPTASLAEESNLIFARSIEDERPMIVLGFFAFGSEESTRQLASAARAGDVPAEEVERSGDVVEWGVMFPRGTDKSAGLRLIRDARTGRFGPLRIDLVVVPIDQALDGIEFDRETLILPAAELTEPE